MNCPPIGFGNQYGIAPLPGDLDRFVIGKRRIDDPIKVGTGGSGCNCLHTRTVRYDVRIARNIFANFHAQRQRLETAADHPDLATLLARVAWLEAEIKRKDQIIAGLQHRLFGSSSEKLDPNQLELLFNELIMGKPAPADAAGDEVTISNPHPADGKLFVRVKAQ